MTKYQDNNGTIFEADTPEELVRYLHEASYAQAESDALFMEEMAGRIRFMSGQEVRHSSCEEFVQDLIKAKQLAIVEDEETEKEDEAQDKS